MPQFLPFAATGANGDPNFPDNRGGGTGGGQSPLQYIAQLEIAEAGGDTQGVTTAYTWVCPDDVYSIYLELGGGGASGGGNAGFQNGGGSGAAWFGWLSVIAGQTYNFTVGQGGGRASGNFSSRLGGNSSIAGSATALINGEASVTITAGGGVGGSVGRGQVAYNAGASLLVRNTGSTFADEFTDNFVNNILRPRDPRHLFGTTFWNSNGRFTSDGSGATGGPGGGNYWASGTASAGNNGGGGGAGFRNATAGGGDGTAAGGGSGGVTISWFSVDQLAAAHPLVIV